VKEKFLIFKEKNYNLKTTISIVLLVGLISGFLGFIYETFFYRIDLGYWVKRGSTYGPIIPVYFFGAIIIVFLTYRLKKHPLLVLLVNSLISGVVEFLTALFFDKVCNVRLWDYNVEIWNWGNVNGYICARSIALFGICSFIFIYLVIPLLFKLKEKVSEKVLSAIAISGTTLFFVDIILHFIFTTIIAH